MIRFESDDYEEPHFFHPLDDLPNTRIGKTIFVGGVENVKDENELKNIFAKYNPIAAEFYKNPDGQRRNW